MRSAVSQPSRPNEGYLSVPYRDLSPDVSAKSPILLNKFYTPPLIISLLRVHIAFGHKSVPKDTNGVG